MYVTANYSALQMITCTVGDYFVICQPNSKDISQDTKAYVRCLAEETVMRQSYKALSNGEIYFYFLIEMLMTYSGVWGCFGLGHFFEGRRCQNDKFWSCLK